MEWLEDFRLEDGAFADVNPVYNEARDLFRIYDNQNEVPDVCE